MKLLSENNADALRNTLTVVLPLLCLYQYEQQLALGMAVGALLISLTDLPGNRRAKTRSALQCLVIFFVVTLVFSLSLTDPVWTGVVLVVLTFLLSMLAAVGTRSLVAGSMGVALMVFLLGLRPHDPWAFSAYILLGGVWFYGVVLVQVFLFPFRSLRQALREALAATGDFLAAKAACYDVGVPLEEGYTRTIALHLRVSEKQELVRQLLISDRAAIRKDDERVRELSRRALLVIGLYEQVTAMHYDYAVVRERLGDSGALVISQELIGLLAAEGKGKAIDQELFDALVAELEACGTRVPRAEAAVIRGIGLNVRVVRQTLDKLSGVDAVSEVLTMPGDAVAFLPDKGDYRKKLRAQLHGRSPVLRFALRLSVLLGLGYTAAHLFAADHYSYWLLLTIVIVARPRLAVTWQRNGQRLLGTFAGVALAGGLLWVLRAPLPLLVVAAVALFGFFVWNRPKYAWSVFCITIAVLLSLSVYRGEVLLLLAARVWYSLLGCALALAGIFVFPVWSYAELEGLMRQAVRANRDFVVAVAGGKPVAAVWLARKEAHVQLARLSEGIRHARVEPGKTNLARLEHIQVLNYRINALIISIFLAGRQLPAESMDRSITNLNAFLQGLPADQQPVKGTGLLKGKQLLEKLTLQLSRSSE